MNETDVRAVQETAASERDRRFWDKTARKYAASPIADEAGFERTLTRTREWIGADTRVLELGCGTGTAALCLADAAGHYVATDLSEGMLAIAREKLDAARRDGSDLPLSLRQATAGSLAREGMRFDTVVGFNYLHLAGDLAGVLGHIRSLLVPGGIFISKTPCLGDMNPLIRLVIPPMRLLGKAPGVSVFSAVALEEAIRAAGFGILVSERHGSKKKDHRPFIVARCPSGAG